MRFAMRFGIWAAALATGCGGASQAETGGEVAASGGEASAGAGAHAPRWLADVPPGGTMLYDVSMGGGAPARRVQMRVQDRVQRGEGVAVLIAPVGTPLDEEPVYARWIVGERDVLVGLDEHAGLTTEPGYAPLDDAGRLLTEATDSIAWRLPRDWLTPGRSVAGGEASAGWQLAERLGDVEAPVRGRECARLTREEAGDHATMTVCANLGVVESTRTLPDGSAGPSWRLVAVSGPPPEGAETPP